ncbi:hypothetical protein C9374_010938 [Naegleria lovaniensis]|uniref:PH domain-containing protein n=1 Tax=Naegleria lovaniensis TaxID=51637 RepID=A0AA88GGB1_NAELO|nr:uncharacterized protein C9374_010938 [Naegleria lovaniensis]KAG2374368.1 hypothetical protein C9374_010938 [Naegleria lovaniensis]
MNTSTLPKHSTTTATTSSNGSPTTITNNNNPSTANATNNNLSTSTATSTVLYTGLLYIPVVGNNGRKPSQTPNLLYKEYYSELYAQVSSSNNSSKSISLSSLGTMFAYYTGTLSSSSAPQVQHFLNLFEKAPQQYIDSLGGSLDPQEVENMNGSSISSSNLTRPLSFNGNTSFATQPSNSNDGPTSSNTANNPKLLMNSSSLSSPNLSSNLKSSVQTSQNSLYTFVPGKKSSLPILSESMKPSIQIPLNNVSVRLDPMEGYFYYFELISPSVIYKFFCRSDHEMRRWTELIEKVSPICKENALIEEAERKIVELERSCNTKKQLTHNNEIKHYRMKYYHHILPSSSNVNAPPSSSSGMLVNNNIQRRTTPTITGNDADTSQFK